jgi:hypothetical protein
MVSKINGHRYLIFRVIQVQWTVRKEVVDIETELAQVFFAKAISVPANGFNDF